MKISTDTFINFLAGHIKMMVTVLVIVLCGLGAKVFDNSITLSAQEITLEAHVGEEGKRLHLTEDQFKVIMDQFEEIKRLVKQNGK